MSNSTLKKVLVLCVAFICIVIAIIIVAHLNNYSIFINNTKKIKNNNMPKMEAASAFYPFGKRLVKEICDEENINEDIIKMVSTNESFNDIVSGKVDLVITTSPSDKQKEIIDNSGIVLKYIPLFKEPLAILVNKNNSVHNLTVEQIQQIYYENEFKWRSFGFEDMTINTYQLEKNNGSQTCFEKIVKNNNLGNHHYEIKLMPDIIDKVGKDRFGICYAFYSYYSIMHKNTNVKVIDVENESILSDNYPLLFDVFLVYKEDNNEKLKTVLNWVNSDVGKDKINKIIGGKK